MRGKYRRKGGEKERRERLLERKREERGVVLNGQGGLGERSGEVETNMVRESRSKEVGRPSRETKARKSRGRVRHIPRGVKRGRGEYRLGKWVKERLGGAGKGKGKGVSDGRARNRRKIGSKYTEVERGVEGRVGTGRVSGKGREGKGRKGKGGVGVGNRQGEMEKERSGRERKREEREMRGLSNRHERRSKSRGGKELKGK